MAGAKPVRRAIDHDTRVGSLHDVGQSHLRGHHDRPGRGHRLRRGDAEVLGVGGQDRAAPRRPAAPVWPRPAPARRRSPGRRPLLPGQAISRSVRPSSSLPAMTSSTSGRWRKAGMRRSRPFSQLIRPRNRMRARRSGRGRGRAGAETGRPGRSMPCGIRNGSAAWKPNVLNSSNSCREVTWMPAARFQRAPLDQRDPGFLIQRLLRRISSRTSIPFGETTYGTPRPRRPAGRRPRSARGRPSAGGARSKSAQFLVQGGPHLRRVAEPPQPAAGEVGHADAVQVHGPAQRHVAVAVAVHVGREDMDVEAGPGQSGAEAVYGADRASVAPGRDVARYDVQYAHGPFLRSVLGHRSPAPPAGASPGRSPAGRGTGPFYVFPLDGAPGSPYTLHCKVLEERDQRDLSSLCDPLRKRQPRHRRTAVAPIR